MTRIALLACLLTTLAACSSASLVRKDPGGGRVLLDGPYMGALAEARVLMAEHCRGRSDAIEVGDGLEFRCRETAASELAALDAGARQLQPQPPPVVPSAPLEASR